MAASSLCAFLHRRVQREPSPTAHHQPKPRLVSPLLAVSALTSPLRASPGLSITRPSHHHLTQTLQPSRLANRLLGPPAIRPPTPASPWRALRAASPPPARPSTSPVRSTSSSQRHLHLRRALHISDLASLHCTRQAPHPRRCHQHASDGPSEVCSTPPPSCPRRTPPPRRSHASPTASCLRSASLAVAFATAPRSPARRHATRTSLRSGRTAPARGRHDTAIHRHLLKQLYDALLRLSDSARLASSCPSPTAAPAATVAAPPPLPCRSPRGGLAPFAWRVLRAPANRRPCLCATPTVCTCPTCSASSDVSSAPSSVSSAPSGVSAAPSGVSIGVFGRFIGVFGRFIGAFGRFTVRVVSHRLLLSRLHERLNSLPPPFAIPPPPGASHAAAATHVAATRPRHADASTSLP